MRTKIWGLAIGIIICILLLFSILLFAQPGGPTKAGNTTGGPVVSWVHTYGNGSVGAILKTEDGGYLLAGDKEIEVTDAAGLKQKKDLAWLGKVDSRGTLQWERFYNGGSIHALLQYNGIYFATGDSSGSLWLLETDKSGNVLIDHSYNNSSYTISGASIASTGDGNFMLAGNWHSPGDLNHAFIARADNNLSIVWFKDLSRYGITYGNSIVRTKDGNFIACGGENGDIARIDIDGNILWNTTLGRDTGLIPVSVCPAEDGGFVAAYLDVKAEWPQGITVSKFASNGTTEWIRIYYGAGSAYVSAMGPVGDGDYVLSGYTNGVKNGVYVLKIDDTGNAIWGAIYDRGVAGPIVGANDGGYIMTAASGPLAITSVPQIELMKLSGYIQ
jgi:hypothetical protein